MVDRKHGEHWWGGGGTPDQPRAKAGGMGIKPAQQAGTDPKHISKTVHSVGQTGGANRPAKEPRYVQHQSRPVDQGLKDGKGRRR